MPLPSLFIAVVVSGFASQASSAAPTELFDEFAAGKTIYCSDSADSNKKTKSVTVHKEPEKGDGVIKFWWEVTDYNSPGHSNNTFTQAFFSFGRIVFAPAGSYWHFWGHPGESGNVVLFPHGEGLRLIFQGLQGFKFTMDHCRLF
jgi:hypothetical protein